MREGSSGFEREDALVCADVLGGFGVSSDHVRERVAEAAGGDGVDDLETAIQRALADPEHPTAFVRRTVAAAPRGVDSPARFWTTAPATQLGDVFAAIDWTFDVRSANGRSLSVEDAQPYRLRVEDADGRTRSTAFSFPDTPLGDDNYPALVHAINEELLYGLNCRFVQLSDGTDRWRFALVETDEYDRLVDRFGERVTAFDRPLLADHQPAAYVPEADATAAEDETLASDVAPVADDVGGESEGGVPVPAWARESRERSWRGRRLTADAFDADHVGGLDHLDDAVATPEAAGEPDADATTDAGGDAGAENESGGRAADAAAAIEFVDDPATDPEDRDDATGSSGAAAGSSDGAGGSSDGAGGSSGGGAGSSDAPGGSGSDVRSDAAAPGLDADGRTVVRDAEATVQASADDATDAGDADGGDDASGAGGDDDLEGWSIGGSVDATTRSSSSTDDAASAVGADEVASGPDATAAESDATAAASDASAPGTGDSSDGLSASGFTWGDDGSDATTDGSAASTSGERRASDDASGSDGAAGSDEPSGSDDGFFSADAAASFDAGAKTSRVEGEHFGVDAGEQTAEDQFAAVGAALAAPAGISCSGLLDDDEFLPHLPRSEPDETRLSFDDEFDPTADPADERETDDGFVWVNESQGVDENRTSASD